MDYTKYNFNANINAKPQAVRYDEGLRSYMLQIYNYMAAALGLTGLVAFLASSTPAIMNMLYVTMNGQITGISPIGWLVTFAPLAFALLFSFGLTRMSLGTTRTLFWAYSAIMGLSLTSLFIAYTGESIARTFFLTASVFGAMSIYGYTTKKDLTGFGSFLMMGLMGIILVSFVNIFLGSTGLQFATSVLSVLIFTGLTAYDTQRLKNIYYEVGATGEAAGKVAIMGALALYMDFINLFIQLLRFFGNRRDD